MPGKPKAGKESNESRWFTRVDAWIKLAVAAAGLIGSLWAANRYLFPSAAVTFPVCTKDLLAVGVENKGQSPASIRPMRFNVSVDGITNPRKMEAVFYEQDGQESGPFDPEQISSLPPGVLRSYLFRTEGIYFRPEYRSCQVAVAVSIDWGEGPQSHAETCECQH